MAIRNPNRYPFGGENRAKASKTVNQPALTPSRNSANPASQRRATPGMVHKADMKLGLKGTR